MENEGILAPDSRKACGSFVLVHIRLLLIVSRFIAGSGKSVLWYVDLWPFCIVGLIISHASVSSKIIRVIESMQETATASMAFFYFDFRDDEKRNCRGLLSSLLVQFCARFDDCCDILSIRYTVMACGNLMAEHSWTV
ncbi:hypothetical protein EDB87DRAFT_813301 [Lactarius vividus]|nr:hypothetical protein EDB87DRAFT_813301 [Lactarius vividus]